MRVIATAGHVDHGKSTLVRALTGIEPDRWAEERARGLTIDLGFAWTRLASGEEVAFVDVPGHERFIANMLAGLGPVPAVMLVVAADEGWRAQSQEHLDAITALGISHGLLVITRKDLADPAPALGQARERLRSTPLAGCEAVSVSAMTGDGVEELRGALTRLIASLPAPAPSSRVRLWIDRSFTIRGAGTVVTGTLESGTLRVGDRVQLPGRTVGIRALESLGQDHPQVSAPARVAVNLRDVAADEVVRGDTLLTGAWHHSEVVDVALNPVPDRLPGHLMAHVGTTSRAVHVRLLGTRFARISWRAALPLQAGDRLVLRDPGQQRVLAGAVVLDADPPDLDRRGAARQRAAELEDASHHLDPAREVHRRGWMTRHDLQLLGGSPDEVLAGVHRSGHYLIDGEVWEGWAEALRQSVAAYAATNPLRPRMPMAAAAGVLGLPDRALLAPLAEDAGLELCEGHVARPGTRPTLGPAEPGLVEIERRLARQPFLAPERQELTELGLGPRQIAAAVSLGRLLDLGDQIVLAPTAPALAMRRLASLPQPFTTSEARQALDTTRRVVIPLLEHLDHRGWTRRLDAGHREVVR
ncbi:selenocysteine-specific translation elongation factor [Raineyella fluvialis]|uniref:Selenocysteine-specific elongation factor n=1 Tax=Raineyella fluvialis TaxID=2662261 RepID=A0A5Q2FE95_9ACTN|nr:selenocysteine-specific translation elongation factor [Raineyella fluvialis]QGF24701.1 selenocysteine-specific translation elongation factor [Raineyella fluvialis]